MGTEKILRRFIAIALVSIGAGTGCSDSGRCEVHGDVLVDGQPLSLGSITFIPTADTQGPSAGGSIADGKFKIPVVAGPRAGKYRVQIIADRATGRTVADYSFGTIPEREQVVFLDDPSLSADVLLRKENQFSFSLKSKKRPM